MQTFVLLPLPFWLILVALAVFGWRFWRLRREGCGFPALAVLATMTVWYLGDVFYNEYPAYQAQFGSYILERVWWEILLFTVAVGLIAPPLHRRINRRLLAQGRRSATVRYIVTDQLAAPAIQHRLDTFCLVLLAVWVCLYAVALVRVDGDAMGLFFPYLGEKADPWSRGRIGKGFDSFIAVASNLQIFLAAAFGVLAAILRRPPTRVIALTVCFLTLPFFIFDRTRNTMLASVLPGFLVWLVFRLRGGTVVKIVVAALAFLATSQWFSFIMAHRSEIAVVDALYTKSDDAEGSRAGNGLNMFEELSWINAFLISGTYQPNWGARYLAEMVNPIPRVLWKSKPMIGIDYAIARGQAIDFADDQAGVATSISTGMIGQGVVNFGGFLGTLASALLISLWIAVLARQDLNGTDPGHFLLYGAGFVLTFNMGRDITLLVLYPYLFGCLMLWAGKKLGGQPRPRRVSRLGQLPRPVQTKSA